MARTRRNRLQVTALEPREVPATLVSPTTVTYQDQDGDNVSAIFSKPFLTAANVNTVFMFASGANAVNGSNATKDQLQRINLAAVPTAAGTTVTLTALPSLANGGDGLAALGELDATGRDLGAVAID